MKEYIRMLAGGTDLSAEDSKKAMTSIFSGESTPAQTAAFLSLLAVKGETPTEIAAFAEVMREHAAKVHPKVSGTLVDVCGTGGDAVKTFNVSTTAMFLVAAAGVAVAKHGNRSFTSKCGSADVLEALGADLAKTPQEIEEMIEKIGVGFMYAQHHHPAMKYVASIRKELGIRTVFNILGPLSNPAGARAQLMGVYSPSLTEKMAEVFKKLGAEKALVVYGNPGIDELSTLGETKVSELSFGVVKNYIVSPEDFGLRRAKPKDLAGGAPEENAKILLGVLRGEDAGPRRDIILLNAAAGIMVGGGADDLSGGLEAAKEALDSGAAYRKLEEFRRMSK
jgi:anthranilate phosphoribosyltransferase